ncbi:MAG TPA: hypothetical protein VG942_12085 [Hyphomonadaceae bacterium]|nr:hypothetical protein [Hyphomonadaceae bacterium]
MRGRLEECFQLSGRSGVVAALYVEDDGKLRPGDWIIVGDAKWRVTGIEIIKRLRVPTSEELRRIAVQLDATKAEVAPSIGKQFETSGAQP